MTVFNFNHKVVITLIKCRHKKWVAVDHAAIGLMKTKIHTLLSRQHTSSVLSNDHQGIGFSGLQLAPFPICQCKTDPELPRPIQVYPS